MSETKNFLRLKDVIRRTTCSRSHIYNLVQQGLFPKPIHLGGRSVAWLESEVAAWMDSKIACTRAAKA